MSEIHQGRWDAAFNKLRSLINTKERHLLSPIWEAYILGAWQPYERHKLNRLAEGREAHPGDKRLAIIKKGLQLHPFNLSDAAVNQAQAANLMATLRSLLPFDTQGREEQWWPWDPKKFVSAIKIEQEAKERGATRGEQIAAVERGGSLRAEASLAAKDNDTTSGKGNNKGRRRRRRRQ